MDIEQELEETPSFRKRYQEHKHDCTQFEEEVNVPDLVDTYFNENLKRLMNELEAVFKVSAHRTNILEEVTILYYVFTSNEQVAAARKIADRYDRNNISEAELERRIMTIQISTNVLKRAKGLKKLEKNFSFYIVVVCLLLFLFVCVRF